MTSGRTALSMSCQTYSPATWTPQNLSTWGTGKAQVPPHRAPRLDGPHRLTAGDGGFSATAVAQSDPLRRSYVAVLVHRLIRTTPGPRRPDVPGPSDGRRGRPAAGRPAGYRSGRGRLLELGRIWRPYSPRVTSQGYLAELFSTNDQVAVVTGGSSGTGRAIAGALAGAGAAVVVVARRQAELAATVDELTVQGFRAGWVSGDLSSRDGVRAAAEGAAELFGEPDILINCAG